MSEESRSFPPHESQTIIMRAPHWWFAPRGSCTLALQRLLESVITSSVIVTMGIVVVVVLLSSAMCRPGDDDGGLGHGTPEAQGSRCCILRLGMVWGGRGRLSLPISQAPTLACCRLGGRGGMGVPGSGTHCVELYGGTSSRSYSMVQSDDFVAIAFTYYASSQGPNRSTQAGRPSRTSRAIHLCNQRLSIHDDWQGGSPLTKIN